jgi:hypothetical protein
MNSISSADGTSIPWILASETDGPGLWRHRRLILSRSRLFGHGARRSLPDREVSMLCARPEQVRRLRSCFICYVNNVVTGGLLGIRCGQRSAV